MAFEGETIGEWTVDRLIRFLEQQRDENPPNQIPTLVCDDLTVAGKLTLIDQIVFSQFQTTVGAAGGASALPATPSGYIRILDYTGQSKVIPFYNA